MSNWKTLISDWGGATNFAESIGVDRSAASKMIARNYVDPRYWKAIVATAPRAGVEGVTLDYLVNLRRGPKNEQNIPPEIEGKEEACSR